MTGDAVALRHVAFEDLGVLEPLLLRRGWRVRTVDAGVDDIGPAEDADLLVVLGGPISANDGDRFPVVADEIAVLRRRIRAGRPTVGICLGAQLIAAALGARVSAIGGVELGYAPLRLGAGGVLAPLDGIPVLHWHGEQVELPAGAVGLASTDRCAVQAFAVGDHVLGLQFHLEVDPAGIERWLIAYADELDRVRVDPAVLRRDAVRYGPQLAAGAETVLDRWLDALAGPTPDAASRS